MRKNRQSEGHATGNEAQLDELGNDPREVGPDSAGQSGDPQRLSTIEDAAGEKVWPSWLIPIRRLRPPALTA